MSRQSLSMGPNPDGNTFFNPSGAPISNIMSSPKAVAYTNIALEEKLGRMTANDDYKPSQNSLQKIAEKSKFEKDFRIIIKYIFKRLNDDGKHWRRIYKALIILEYLLKKGNPLTVVETTKPERKAEISTLIMFQYAGKNREFDGIDIGTAVREKAKEIIEIVERFEVAASRNDDHYQPQQNYHEQYEEVGEPDGAPALEDLEEDVEESPVRSGSKHYSQYGTYKGKGVNPFANSGNDPFSSSGKFK